MKPSVFSVEALLYMFRSSGPETCHVNVKLFAPPQPEALHDDKYQSQPNAHRWEQEVKRESQRELDSGKDFGAHICSFPRSSVTAACSDANNTIELCEGLIKLFFGANGQRFIPGRLFQGCISRGSEENHNNRRSAPP